MIIRNQFGRAAQAVTEPTHLDAKPEGFTVAPVEAPVHKPEALKLSISDIRRANLAKGRAVRAAKREQQASNS